MAWYSGHACTASIEPEFFSVGNASQIADKTSKFSVMFATVGRLDLSDIFTW